MGFCPITPAFASSALGSVTVALPAAVKDGDLLFLFIYSNNGAGITTPTGWTLQGVVTNVNGGSVGLYTKTWHTGDPVSGIALTTGSGFGNTAWCCCAVRSSAAASIVSDQTNSTVSSTTKAVKSFPPTRVGDLRLLFYFLGTNIGGDSLTAPAVTPSDNNPPGVKFQLAANTLNAGLSGGVWFSLNEDPSGADVGIVNWTSAQADTGYLRSVVVDDGSGTYSAADEVALYLINPNVEAVALEEEASSGAGLSSAAGKFGGGAHLL